MLNRRVVIGVVAVVVLFLGFFSFAQGNGDTTKPIIKLIGRSTEKVVLGSTTYADEGATVTDNVDKDRTIDGVLSGSTTAVGTYHLNYNATDAAGNVAKKVTRTINVLSPNADEDGDGFTNLVEINAKTDFNDPNSFPEDDTAPVISFNNYTKTPTNQNIVVNATTNEGTLNVTSHTFTANGNFTFTVTDDAGNATTRIVRISNIDKAAPVITIGDYIVVPTNKDITVSATTNEGTLNATSNVFTANGSFTFTATDAAGNVTNKTVTISNIDKTAPKITIGAYITTPTNQEITVSATTNEGTLNEYTHKFVANDHFDFIATDAAGNITTKTGTISNIDKEVPEVGFGTNGPNATYAKSANTTVTVSDIDEVDETSLKYVWTKSSTTPTDAEFTNTFTNGTIINSKSNMSGIYYLWILAKDRTGNTVRVMSNAFRIDNVKPGISGVRVDTNYNHSVIPVVNEENLVGLRLLIEATPQTIDFTSGTEISTEGRYVLTATDEAGNATGVNFYLDYTHPAIKNGDTAIITGSSFSTDVNLVAFDRKLTEVKINLQSFKVDRDKKYFTVISNQYSSNVTFKYTLTDEGPYTVVTTDLAGNKTIVTFTIDKTDPTITKLKGSGNNTINLGDTFIDAGIEYSDNYDANNLLTVNTWYTFKALGSSTYIENAAFDTSRAGQYYKYYTVTDRSGNTSGRVSRGILVVDNIAPSVPTIDLNGYNQIWTNQSVKININATDNIFNTLKYQFSSDNGTTWIDTTSELNFSNNTDLVLIFRAIDATDNIGDPTVTYVVKIDKELPNIIVDPASITLQYKDDYIDMNGVSATDNHGTPTITSDYNPTILNTLGSHIITYTVTDSVGNVNTAIRTLTIKDSAQPTINFKNDMLGFPMYIETSIGYDKKHLTRDYYVTDNYDTNLGAVITTRYKTIIGLIYKRTFAIGTTYTATDGSGNITTRDYDFLIPEQVSVEHK